MNSVPLVGLISRVGARLCRRRAAPLSPRSLTVSSCPPRPVHCLVCLPLIISTPRRVSSLISSFPCVSFHFRLYLIHHNSPVFRVLLSAPLLVFLLNLTSCSISALYPLYIPSNLLARVSSESQLPCPLLPSPLSSMSPPTPSSPLNRMALCCPSESRVPSFSP